MMNSYAEKTVEQSKTIADNGTKSSFINNRPEALTMQNLKDSANNSAQVQQLKAYQTMADQAIIQRQANTTGMPDNLKSGIENLSGYSMSDVKVHYNSDKPAQLNAHAYAQGTQIHLASGQEKHLPHEAWHVVQQKQGRVKPTMQLKGKVAINDDAGLENEADVMGAKALTTGVVSNETSLITNSSNVSQTKLIQCYTYGAGTTRKVTVQGVNDKNVFEECTYNFVEFKAGEAKRDGSKTATPASWANWLTNKKGGNNATQLHVVNKRWGGLGGQGDKNIVPGTPAENSHHLHQAEKEFDKCFNGSDKAINDCKYECTVTPKYGTNVDVTGGDKDYGDPTISVDITDNGVKVNHPVDDGVDGLTFKDAS
ncbi:MAG: hypothetical protein CHH17_05540 [Candidatus Fluviicola riflensis]|nr:MAG: hypothetical protein CHH17_05540 [Candidatus Fluviicola riflensis]